MTITIFKVISLLFGIHLIEQSISECISLQLQEREIYSDGSFNSRFVKQFVVDELSAYPNFTLIARIYAHDDYGTNTTSGVLLQWNDLFRLAYSRETIGDPFQLQIYTTDNQTKLVLPENIANIWVYILISCTMNYKEPANLKLTLIGIGDTETQFTSVDLAVADIFLSFTDINYQYARTINFLGNEIEPESRIENSEIMPFKGFIRDLYITNTVFTITEPSIKIKSKPKNIGLGNEFTHLDELLIFLAGKFKFVNYCNPVSDSS